MNHLLQIFCYFLIVQSCGIDLNAPFIDHIQETRKTFNFLSFYELKCKLSDKKTQFSHNYYAHISNMNISAAFCTTVSLCAVDSHAKDPGSNL